MKEITLEMLEGFKELQPWQQEMLKMWKSDKRILLPTHRGAGRVALQHALCIAQEEYITSLRAKVQRLRAAYKGRLAINRAYRIRSLHVPESAFKAIDALQSGDLKPREGGSS